MPAILLHWPGVGNRALRLENNFQRTSVGGMPEGLIGFENIDEFKMVRDQARRIDLFGAAELSGASAC